jgi:hypothetical protein
MARFLFVRGESTKEVDEEFAIEMVANGWKMKVVPNAERDSKAKKKSEAKDE